MPIYEYRCSSCGHELEKLQRISDAPLTDCPDCGKPELRRLISAAGFRLKGSGWYETDFKKGGKRNVVESSASGESKTSSKDDTGKSADSKSSDSGKSESPSKAKDGGKADSSKASAAS